MTKIKLCGLRRPEDIEVANELQPDFIGFVFVPKSKRYISFEEAPKLKRLLTGNKTKAVGVFVNESIETIAGLLESGIIDIAQLHGTEDENYIDRLRTMTSKPIIKAFKIQAKADLKIALESTADFILLDDGAGDGVSFDWDILKDFSRPYFLAGGLDPENVGEAIEKLHPYGVDVSSGIETDSLKDPVKMQKFVENVRSRA